MALFPQHFIDDLKRQADVLTVIQDYVSLKKTGATYKGLCPFHGEKTPSFHVNRDKGFFHCFGCGVGGDVFKFLELHEKVGFQDSVKQLAQRFGVTIPELEQNDEQRASSAERETLLKVHESAAAWFREQLASPAAARIRKQIADREVSDETAQMMGLGYAPAGRDGLIQALRKQGYTQATLVRAGLAYQRDDGSVVDRFRNRLMIPICRDTGAIIAFGGRALDKDQQPKYLNSPETPIYTKGRTLYGLHLSKSLIRQTGFAVLVEGYFDFGQVFQVGYPAVASSGTALTTQQAQQLRRFTGKIVLSFDPDAAGEGAAAKSSGMLVEEGFEVNVAVLPKGEDPDTFVRKHGREGYGERLRQSQPYLEYLLQRAAARQNLNTAEGRARLVAEMLPVALRIPDKVRQQLFVEAVSGRSGVPGELIFTEIRKAGGRPAAAPAREMPSFSRVTKAEKGLIWWLVHDQAVALQALVSLEDADIEPLATGSVLDLARKLNEDGGFSPSVLLERLTMVEAQLVTGVASEGEPPVHDVAECVRSLQRLRYERERAAVQRDIERLQQQGAAEHSDGIDALWARKRALLKRIEELS
jgi:DNA primase